MEKVSRHPYWVGVLKSLPEGYMQIQITHDQDHNNSPGQSRSIRQPLSLHTSARFQHGIDDQLLTIY